MVVWDRGDDILFFVFDKQRCFSIHSLLSQLPCRRLANQGVADDYDVHAREGSPYRVLPSKFAVQRAIARNRAAHRENPMIVRLDRRGEMFSFAEERGGRCFNLFVPEGVKSGDELEVVWRDPQCACAMKVTPTSA